MGEINTTKFWEMLKQCHLLYDRIFWETISALQRIHIKIAQMVSTYLSSLHSSSHFLESRAKFSNEVMLSIGIPVPNYALGRQRGKEQASILLFRQKRDFIEKHYRRSYNISSSIIKHWVECFI